VDEGAAEVGDGAGGVGEKPVPGVEVQRGRGFIQEQQGGIGGEGAGEVHALLFAAGQGGRGSVGEVGQAELVEDGVDTVAPFGSADPTPGQGEVNVAADGGGQQARLLGDEGDPSALGHGQSSGGGSVDMDDPGGGVVDAGEQPQQGGLAGPVGSEDRDSDGGGDLEVIEAEDVLAAATVVDILQGHDRAHAAPRCWMVVRTLLTAKASMTRTTA